MPRDIHGKPVEPLKTHLTKALKTKKAQAGIAHKPDDMKSEDQGGKDGSTPAGHVTEKKGVHYGRKRH